MSERKFNVFVAVTLAIMLAAVFIPMAFPEKALGSVASDAETEYADKLFGTVNVVEIDIQVDSDKWQSMLDNALSKEYIECDVVIDGKKLSAVGLRAKGNSSLSSITNSDSDRVSFKLEFDHYISGQTLYGLDKLALNSNFADASYMKEYLSYALFRYMDVPSSLCAYANITVNGEPWGFYLAAEGIEESYAERNFGAVYGSLYKPESTNAAGGGKQMGNFEAGAPLKAELPDAVKPDDNFAGMDPVARAGIGASGAGTDLVYVDGDLDSYSGIFDQNVFDKTSKKDDRRVVAALKGLSGGTDLEKYIDVDEVLRYFAVNTVLVNLDHYVGSMKHNYYLYEKDGVLSMLPWDYNLAFGGFQAGSASEAVNFPIDTPVSGTTLSERPMIGKLLEVPEYLERYHEYLQQIVTEFFDGGIYERTISELDSMISAYVENDLSAFYTYDDYKAAISGMLDFGKLRAKSIQSQLNGTIPSTEEEQTAKPELLIDAGSLNLSVLGTQGGGRDAGGNGMPGPIQQNGGQAGAAAQEDPANPETTKQRPDMQNFPGGNQRFGQGGITSQTGFFTGTGNALMYTGISAVFLIAGLIFVIFYKKRRFRV